jgi:hypothetical protein
MRTETSSPRNGFAVIAGGAALRRVSKDEATALKCYISDMTTIEDIEKAVEQLAPRELARFRTWFEAFDSEQFDAAIERDAHAGKLDAHADEALAGHSRDDKWIG